MDLGDYIRYYRKVKTMKSNNKTKMVNIDKGNREERRRIKKMNTTVYREAKRSDTQDEAKRSPRKLIEIERRNRQESWMD